MYMIKKYINTIEKIIAILILLIISILCISVDKLLERQTAVDKEILKINKQFFEIKAELDKAKNN